MDIPAELTHEVGVGKLKLPVGLWLVAIVIGVYVSRHSSLLHFGASTTTTDATVDPNATTNVAGVPLLAGGAVGVTPGGAFDSGASTSIADNEAWRVAATQYLTNQNFNALAAATAVAKYLDGDPLTTVEQGMIEKALRALGPTPEPVELPIGQPVPPTPAPGPAPSPTTKPIQQATPSVRITNPKFGIAGEKFVAFANTQDGKGTWWLTNKGGLWSAGSAPFYGAPSSRHTATYARLVTRWPTNGYTAIDTAGKTVSLP